MSGRVGNLSFSQRKALEELKADVSDIHKPDYDDYFYLRWLRARSFDKTKAEDMLRKSLMWRKRIGADTILRDYEPNQLLDTYFPHGVIGTDSEGSPILYFSFKEMDLKGYYRCCSKLEVLRFLAYIIEQAVALMREMTEKLGVVVEDQTIIFDGEGYNFSRATDLETVDILNDLLKTYEDNYPERLKRGLIINAPTFISVLLTFARPFVSDETFRKLKVYNKDGYQDHLLSFVDPEVLPKFLGGRRVDSDGDTMCRSLVHFGGFVPMSYYFNRSYEEYKNQDGVKSVVVDKNSTFQVEIPVSRVNSRITWDIQTEKRDIAIGLYLKKSEDYTENKDLEVVLSPEKCKCYMVAETYTYTCEKTGTYVVKFDNTYSWFLKKKVLYKITVE